jgi:hypothetical protein
MEVTYIGSWGEHMELILHRRMLIGRSEDEACPGTNLKAMIILGTTNIKEVMEKTELLLNMIGREGKGKRDENNLYRIMYIEKEKSFVLFPRKEGLEIFLTDRLPITLYMVEPADWEGFSPQWGDNTDNWSIEIRGNWRFVEKLKGWGGKKFATGVTKQTKTKP